MSKNTMKRPINILVGFPCMDSIPTGTMASLIALQKPIGTKFTVIQNSLVHYARNEIAAKAITGEYDAVLWIDSDMKFESGAMMQLVDDMFGAGTNRRAVPRIDYVAGLFFKRSFPTTPVVYSSIDYDHDGNNAHCNLITYDRYPDNAMFECAGTGFGFVLTSVRLLKEVWEAFGPPFDPMLMLGEDISFCKRVEELDEKMFCDSRVKIGHIGRWVYDESTWKMQKAIPPEAWGGAAK